MKSRTLSIFALLCLSPLSFAELRLPAVISDHLVLQRETTVPLWGWADPGEVVTVTTGWDGERTTATAGADGRWRLEVATGEAGGPHHLTFEGKNRIEFEDVLLGEVWVCSGQSNMEWTINRCAPLYEDVRSGANHPTLRIFDVQRKIATTPQEDCGGEWRACTPAIVGEVSAVAFFFGRDLLQELNVPIGLLCTNWGGTVSEAWTSDETMKTWPEFAASRAVVEAHARSSGGVEDGRQAASEAWWAKLDDLDPGRREGWMNPEFDDSEWATQTVPNNWGTIDLAGFDGIVWMRRTIEIPESWSGQDLILRLGPIDDQDTTYFNGVEVGGHHTLNSWTTPRTYRIPGDLVRKGEAVIAVEVYDSGGAGGLFGDPEQMDIAAENSSRAIPLAGSWRYRVGLAKSELPSLPNTASLNQNFPAVLFNGMIAPILSYAIRGAIWYQGESNRTRAFQYRELFPAMIRDWRRHWGLGEFPFYFVQIAPYRYGSDRGEAAELREAQMMALRLPGTGMAVTMDIGNPGDIHPKKKLEVGERLALWAKARTYGRDVATWSGPSCRGMALEGSSIRLHFDHVGSGLSSGDEALTCFTIAGSDRVFHPATAEIDGETIVVTSKAVPVPAAVRFAWGAADQPNLKNKEGLPSSSFRTDDWPGMTAPR
jgi:sialate O-acetylesterase